ncbi:hypothetical protein ACIBP5_16790 [Nonomuraea indica]|uniref:Uncharacterized protein n=1 Tax=Nonomuraea indica TaxID=1581193 RepID=A0ABW8A4B8_9ACTN|nr:hypothetical protein [Nonomuraea indica]
MDFETREGRERARGRRALSRERAAYSRLVRKHVGAPSITSAAPPDVRGKIGQNLELRAYICEHLHKR